MNAKEMTDDPYLEASKYHRACIREHDRYRRVLDDIPF